MRNFIPKLQTEKYLIGSFDSFIDLSKKIIKDNSNLDDDRAAAILKSMPTNLRAAITDMNGNYIGYIGLFDIHAQDETASIRFEVMEELTEESQEEILAEYKKYLKESLNIKEIHEFIYKSKTETNHQKKEIIPSTNIVIPKSLLKPGIKPDILERYQEDYQMPKLQLPYSIMSHDKVIGIIGLSNVLWSNKRANLNIYIDKRLGSDIINELASFLIDDYIQFAHRSNIHNVMTSINGSDKDMLELINNTSMNYFGKIPYGKINGENLESNMMFQHLPNMKKENGIILPDNKIVTLSSLERDRKNLNDEIDLGNGYRLIRPNALEKSNIDSNKIIDGHIKAMQEREGFTIPLGEDKYFLQKGNGNYGISKAVMNYSYIIIDEKNNYAGYINILRENAGGKNAEIEIGIAPKLQHRGLGTSVINKFYDELFSIGYASVTSAVFEFNNPSLKLHEKVAELNGIRLESYYINGKLWDMNFYSKVNSSIENNKKHL